MPTYRRVARKAPPVVKATPAPAPDYDSRLKADLVAEAEGRGIDSSGTKAEIVARLKQ